MSPAQLFTYFPRLICWVAGILCALPLLANAQTLNIGNDVQTYATLSNTAITVSGKAELRITGSGDPIAGCTINLTSPDAWLFLTNILPSQVVSTFLSRVQVNGAAAVAETNVRVVQYGMGAVVIPHAPTFAAMEVFEGKCFTGPSRQLRCYVAYDAASLGNLKGAISSFRLKRGYTATIAQNENGTGVSRNYVAQDGDLEVSALPAALDNKVSFVRVFPWRWVSKKGIAGNIWQNLNVRWYYNWNLDQNSSRDLEYVPIRQSRYWPGMGQDWKARGSSHLLGYNEPDHTDQANLTVAEAISSWPDLLGTGLRVGAPAVSDGGLSWLYSFIDQADAAGLRVDFVPVHYYRSYSNAANPDGAATQLYNFLKGIYDRTHRPIWLTEFNNGANWTTDPDPTAAQQQATVAKMIEMLDNTPFVERYSIYNWVEDVRRVVWDDGSLTAAGTSYRDKLSPVSYVQELPDAGLSGAAHFAFNGDARDILGNGNDAMSAGALTFAPGKYGQALVLDGVNDYLQVPPGIGDSTDFSFTGWIKWNGGANWQRIFDFGEGTSRYFFLTPKTSGGKMRFTINAGSGEQVLDAPAALTIGQWTHVAVTLSGSTGKLFVNGALVATNTAMTSNPVDVGTRLNFVGKSQFAADPLFSGQLDELRYFTTALTDGQVATIAGTAPPQFSGNPVSAGSATQARQFTGSLTAAVSGGSGALTFSKVSGPAWLAVAPNGVLTGIPGSGDAGLNRFYVRVTDANGAIAATSLEINVTDTPGLVARYKFDGTATDSFGSAHGVTTGSPVYAAGRYGSAIDLDGTSNFVTVPALVANQAELTVATWVWWDGTSAWQRIFDFGTGTSEYLILTPRSGSNTLRFEIKYNGVSQILDTNQLATGQWVHVAVTLGAGTGRLYVNGVLKDSRAITIKPTDFGPTANYIGKSQFSDPLFNGRIDEFLLFNRALTAAQVSSLYGGGRGPVFGVNPVSMPAAAAGQPYEQSIAGSATDADPGSALSFTKVSGPEWLVVSPDGRISGVPAMGDVGTNRFVVRATDGAMLAAEAALNIGVTGSVGLVARYQFNGTTADDQGGSPGTATGAPIYNAGLYDQAIVLDGIDDSVQLPAGVVTTLRDITIAARVRWNGGSNWQRIFDFGRSTTQYMALTPQSGSGTLRFLINGGAGEQKLEFPAPLPVGEWAHVAVTLTGDTGTLYLNGAPVATGSITIDPSTVAPINNYLGKSQFADPLFTGSVDDFRIYGRGLSAAEVSALAVPPPAVNVPDSSYGAWAAGIPFQAGQSAGSADPDRDGISNAWEYLFRSDPLTPGSEVLPQVRTLSAGQLGLSGTKSYLALQARVRKQRLGATLTAEAGASIQELATAGAATHARMAGAPIPDGEFEVVTFYYDVAIEDSASGGGAIRLRVDLR